MDREKQDNFSEIVPTLIRSGPGTRKRMPRYILLIHPDSTRRRWLQQMLTITDYEVQATATADAALRLALADLPLLVIADIASDMPPSFHRLRRQNEIPLILLSFQGTPGDELVGLRMGADDVIIRPDNRELLLARVSALLRRTAPAATEKEESDPIILGDMRIDPSTRTVSIDQRPIELTAREFNLLYTLARDAGAVVSRDELLDRVWGPDFEGETQTVYVYISWLRKKLENIAAPAPRIVTVHGVGYKLVDSERD